MVHNQFFEDKKTMLDNLTGIYIRDVITEYMHYLVDNNIPFTFSIIDIDNFKTINDNHGHLVGDEILKINAINLEKMCSGRGVVGRYGGDEFIFVFPEVVDYDDVWHIGFDILKSSSKLELPEGDISVTYTMGFSRFPLNGATVEELFEVADKALYRGKMKGRNCFIIYLPEKHANINLKSKRDTINSPIHIHSEIYEIMHENKNIDDAIQWTMNYLGSNLMIDHVCIETHEGLKYEYIHPIAGKKDGYVKIGWDLIEGMMNTDGLFVENTVLTSIHLKNNNPLYALLSANGIYSTVIFKIKVKNGTYGFLRCDMASMDTGRIWQQEDLITIQFVAIVIGLVLEGKGE